MELPPFSCKRPLEESDSVNSPPSKRAHVERPRRERRRQPKPPYTYIGMMVVAIQTSPDQRLTLAQIQDALQDMFPFFRGEYTGWKDSIRHFLSYTPCFVKVHRVRTKTSKGNFWTVDLSLVSPVIFRKVKGAVSDGQDWAPTLTEQLKITDISLPAPRTPPTTRTRCRRRRYEATKDNSTTSVRSFSYTEAQYTRYLREQAPLETVSLDQYPPFASLLYQTATSTDYTAAAANLNRLCPEPQFWSPPPTTRTCGISNTITLATSGNISNSTNECPHTEVPPSARQSLLPALEAEVAPAVNDEKTLSDLDAFFRDFAQSLVESNTQVESNAQDNATGSYSAYGQP